MSKDKKQPKPRPEHYEAKVALKTDFHGAMNILATQANKVVKDRLKDKKDDTKKDS